ncbi:MAG TPA: orotidine-5'-phosphate decarboxylase [Steroidobacteraceae bacterium]|jgi:orotidine-5'-phosphate decarboxylase|nr:orotidine-5'-phosphate decarboxylase [Steroidobacteraceae bacterium]
MGFMEKLGKVQAANRSLVCVGLDPDLSRFPRSVEEMDEPIFEFNKAIIDATHDLVCAYKPQIAHYAAESAEAQLESTIAYIKSTCPDVPIILDAKRGDIGSTAQMYATEAFERYAADAVTVNPYLGFDSLEPFLSYTDRGVIALCRTSNAGAADLQDLQVDGVPLYEKVASLAATKWNKHGNLMLVVGATWPEQLSRIRAIVGDMPLLVPGVGAQGGDVAKLVQAGQTAAGAGLIINSSRAILYASDGEDFAAAARRETERLRDEINGHRKGLRSTPG